MADKQLEEPRRDALAEDDGSGLGTVVKAIAALVGLGLVVYLVAKIVRD